MEFQLHHQLKTDLIELVDFELSKVMLLPNSENPWVVLVPRVANIKEWHQLCHNDQAQLCWEITKVSEVLEAEFQPEKLNVGSLGNMVPQLHVHVICRYKTDSAWPGAIWGHALNKDEATILKMTTVLKVLLAK